MNTVTIVKPQLELSTQILIEEAERRRLKVDVLDVVESFIRIEGVGKREYIKQATRTSVDNYSAPLLMENKQVTKQLLEEAGIQVPKGKVYLSKQEGLDDYSNWIGQDLVIKPNSTNFGTAVHTLFDGHSIQQYSGALEDAFLQDSQVLAENFASGREYRFLVIGDEVNAVLHRIPANVVGDGKNCIRELVEKKNHHPFRGKGYVRPLEYIKQTVVEREFLAMQGMDFDTVLEEGKQIFLRENSNISTGGDSLDMTDTVHADYKTIALESTKVVGARICGVDMMIDDIHSLASGINHSIIELNFNPAIHIHTYPLEGENREPAKAILDLLGF